MENQFDEIGMHHGTNKELFQFARELRGKMTEAEKVLWEELKEKKLNGFKIRRQHPIGNYILDFYCHKAKLAIELDGEYHENIEQKEYDELRTNRLKEVGIKEIRFKNQEIFTDLKTVLTIINEALKADSSLS